VLVPPGPPARPNLAASTTPRTIKIISNTNYGTLIINGTAQRTAPPLTVTLRDQPPYSITLTTPPFQPRTCEFPPPKSIVPYGFHPCNAGQTIFQDQAQLPMLEIFFTLADLSPTQQQQITTLIANGLTIQQTLTTPMQSTIVTALNQDGTITSKRFSEPLTASVSLVPSMDNPQRGVFCFSFTCVGPSGFSSNFSASGKLWQVLTPIALRWRFTTASGQVVSDVTFPASPTLLNLLLSYDAAAGWSIAPPFASPETLNQQLTQLVCSTGVQMLSVQRARYLSGDGWDVSVLHNQGIAGCELALIQQHTDQGHFVWRFGALLATDAQSHALLPMLPSASPAEVTAVGG
jgi:hypothetical protein